MAKPPSGVNHGIRTISAGTPPIPVSADIYGATIINNNQVANNDFGLNIIAGVPTNVGQTPFFISFSVPGVGNPIGIIYEDVTASSVHYQTTSDARLKENIRDSEIGLATLMSIKVRDFNWKISPGVERQGFIAQELQEVYPQAVRVGGEDVEKDPWGVEYGALTPILVKAIQDLSLEVTALKAELASLREIK